MKDTPASPAPASSDRFPPEFLWGCATSAYQIEGAADEDGRSPSLWDAFCRIPGKVANGDTGDRACEHYRLYKEDVALMARLGMKAYRFSVSWPRVLPAGVGRANPKGLDFYDRLVDALLEKGIAPFLTLYHWDHPQALEDRGGWLNRDMAAWFAEYAAVVARRLSDRVSHWMTLNEPPCVSGLGYEIGLHPPGRRDVPQVVNQVQHHLLLAHGRGAEALRRSAVRPVKVGLAHNPSVKVPATDAAEDLSAARRAWRRANGVWFDPLFRGTYPADLVNERAGDMPRIEAGDMAVIRTPMDFMGFNFYSGTLVRAKPGAPGDLEEPPFPASHPKTAMGWNVVPASAYWGLKHFFQEYPGAVPEAFVTENGCAYDDAVGGDGRVDDPLRREYIASHLRQVRRAMAEGVPVKGYFAWSFMDNMEWSFGYSKRFGLVHVDYATQRRTPKESAHWYRRLIEAGSLPG